MATRGAARSSVVAIPLGTAMSVVAFLAVVVWKVWDHLSTAAEYKPLLRDNIDQFLALYKGGLLESDGVIRGLFNDLQLKISTAKN